MKNESLSRIFTLYVVDLSKYLDWIKLSPRYLLPIALFTGFVLFAPPEWLATFGLTTVVEGYRWIFGLAFLLSAVLLVSSGLVEVLTFASRSILDRRLLRQRRRRLHQLSGSEKEVLLGYIEYRTRTRYLPPTSGEVGGLVAENILFQSSNLGDIDAFAYNIKPWAWDYLNAHPELLDVSQEQQAPPR